MFHRSFVALTTTKKARSFAPPIFFSSNLVFAFNKEISYTHHHTRQNPYPQFDMRKAADEVKLKNWKIMCASVYGARFWRIVCLFFPLNYRTIFSQFSFLQSGWSYTQSNKTPIIARKSSFYYYANYSFLILSI